MGRYDVDFSRMDRGPARPVKRKTDPLEEMLRIGGGLAPVAGTAIGGLIGAGAGGIGAVPGAAIGGAIGSGVGGLMGAGADAAGKDEDEEMDEATMREQERVARNQAIHNFMMGL